MESNISNCICMLVLMYRRLILPVSQRFRINNHMKERGVERLFRSFFFKLLLLSATNLNEFMSCFSMKLQSTLVISTSVISNKRAMMALNGSLKFKSSNPKLRAAELFGT